MEYTPLDVDTLSEAARKALTGPMRIMAARGVAPLAKPADLASVVYQLTLDGDVNVRVAAEKTAGEIPDKVLLGALTDGTLDARVIDFFSAKVWGKRDLLDAVLLNRNAADDTILALAARVGEREIEIISTNEQRLLRAPAIIGAIYMNPRSRMSTVDRCVELAVRNQITVSGVPSWDAVVAAVLGTQERAQQPPAPEVDAAFAAAATVGVEGAQAPMTSLDDAEEGLTDETVVKTIEDTAKEKLQLSKLSIPAKIRLATLGNSFARSVLVRDSNKMIALAAIKSPGVTDNEVVKFSSNRGLSDEVVREIANNKGWTRLYQVKSNLVNNPKTPLQAAMRFLPFLHEKDLRNVARSKGIPSALVAQAKKLMTQKAGK